MGGVLEGRVAVITGAGRGLGRSHALQFAAEGARVVVNDLGGGGDGTGHDRGVAESVAQEIRDMGGEAVANGDDAADWEGGRRLVQSALEAFGRLDILVNNAGILRDRFIVNMSEEEWDSVIRVHLRGHFCPTRHAGAYWREESQKGGPVQAAVINTTSGSGLFGQPGQINYGAAKAGIAAFTVIAAGELERYGVRVNAIAPMARTRLTEGTPGWEDMIRPPDDPEAFDAWDPSNVSPVVAWLATAGCPVTGQVFYVHGGTVKVFTPWEIGDGVERNGRWTVSELAAAFPAATP